MKKYIYIVASLFLVLVSCKNEEAKEVKTITTEANIEKQDSIVVVELTKCDCIEPQDENKEWCNIHFKNSVITAQDKFECTGDSVYLDTIPQVVKDSIREEYENDLSLEIKEIEEEKTEPISEDCKLFLEDYAEAIKAFKSLSDKIEKHPEDIGLKISYRSESEELESWASKPQMFQCSQNEAFKKQVEILNVKKDKLLEN